MIGEDATDAIVSPYKRARSSVSGLNNMIFGALESHVSAQPPPPAAQQKEDQQPHASTQPDVKQDVKETMSDDEEL